MKKITKKNLYLPLLLILMTSSCVPENTAELDELETETETIVDGDNSEVAESVDDNVGQPQGPVQDERPSTNTGQTSCRGHDCETLISLPQLDYIGYFETEHEFARYDGEEVKVAILDGNFNAGHPDIVNNVVATYNFARPDCADNIDYTNSLCTDVAGKLPSSPNGLGTYNHGTNIAGVIAGHGIKGEGSLGVNPSAKLYLFQRDSGGDNLKALRGAIDAGVDVISMSWPLGKPPGDKDVPEFKALLEEARNKGIVVVMAAGNRKQDVNSTMIYPTVYAELDGVIAVGSIKDDGLYFDAFSNFGTDYVTIGAPGTVHTAGGNYDNALYSIATGTSFSGPMVAAAASRVIQFLKFHNRVYKAQDIEKILEDSARKSFALADYFKDGNELYLPTLLDYLENYVDSEVSTRQGENEVEATDDNQKKRQAPTGDENQGRRQAPTGEVNQGRRQAPTGNVHQRRRPSSTQVQRRQQSIPASGHFQQKGERSSSREMVRRNNRSSNRSRIAGN